MPGYQNYSDNELLGLLKTGDEAAFTQIYDRYWKLLFYVSYKRLEQYTEAEESVQDIFTDIWARRETLQVNNSLKYYLAAAAQYQVLNQFTKRNKRNKLNDHFNLQSVPAHADQLLNFHQLENQIQELVNALSEKCRLVYQLSRDQGLTNKEIAERLDISEKTVENQLTKALGRFRKGLGDAAMIYFILSGELSRAVNKAVYC